MDVEILNELYKMLCNFLNLIGLEEIGKGFVWGENGLIIVF